MSYEAVSIVQPHTSHRRIAEFLLSIGYARVPVVPFWYSESAHSAHSWYDARDYRSHVGVYAEIASPDDQLIVYLRSNIGASYWDLEKLNGTLRHIRKNFGGGFESDHGKNRYFPLPEERPVPEESGCEFAHLRFEAAITRATLHLSSRRFPDTFERFPFDLLPTQSPWILSNNLLLPYIVSVLEDYFRSTYVALAKYSDRKTQDLQVATPRHQSSCPAFGGQDFGRRGDL